MNAPDSTRAPQAYPSPLQIAEDAAIRQRRRAAGVDLDAPRVGVALSGGGIRSATFCLGLFQALARQKLIRRVDYLSTVSGGGYFGSFLGAAFTREAGSPDTVERELSDSHSWPVNWLRQNGRFLSPNGAGDNWLTAAVALRNWVSLQIVLLTFGFFLLGLGAVIRTDFATGRFTHDTWTRIERFFWQHPVGVFWGSPWLLLPVIPFVLLMVPTGTVYWLTQALPVVAAARRLIGVFKPAVRTMTTEEFASRAQLFLTRVFMLGLMATVVTLLFGLVDSIGQTTYRHWSDIHFTFPSLWTMLTAGGAAAFGLATKAVLYVEPFISRRKFQIPFNLIALALALVWLLLIIVALSVVECGFAWDWGSVHQDGKFAPMLGGWKLMLAVTITFFASWIFSRSFGFVNLSSMQQTYAARLSRAYLGATNPERRRHANYNMTELIPGDELALEEYAPHAHGGPLHLINVTVNETISGKTQIERVDRKGVSMAVGPCGLSVSTDSHVLWAEEPPRDTALLRLRALWETRQRAIIPICPEDEPRANANALSQRRGAPCAMRRIEALALGRWVAVSGAAFTTGIGAYTAVGLSLLLGLANVRLGYWWDSGVTPGKNHPPTRPNFLELSSRLLSWLMPVQTCLMNEFFARFHGPARRHWYLSDGGHFENTACYELIRRRVPFIICSDAGGDASFQFGDLANLVRKARTDFGAEIQIARRAADHVTDDPGVRHPMPTLDSLVHPSLLDVIGGPEDFSPRPSDLESEDAPPTCHRTRKHAMLARIHYLDTDEFGWLLIIKPSLMGDETTDVLQYQCTHPQFPHEPTTDQYFDEAQWESYRKLGEHIGAELFTAPASGPGSGSPWSPSMMCSPDLIRPSVARIQELPKLSPQLS